MSDTAVLMLIIVILLSFTGVSALLFENSFSYLFGVILFVASICLATNG